MHSEGEGSGLFDDASHLAARVAAEVLGHDRFAVTVRSQIPVARGLGSSAALAAAAAAAAGAEDPFAVAAAYDGHPENAAASVFGGLVAATTVEGRPVHAPLPLSDELAFVAIVPERNLATPEARGVLPETLTRADAVFNLGRMGLLVAGLADPDVARGRGDGGPHPPAGPHGPVPRGARRSCGALVDAGRAGRLLVGGGTDADRHRVGGLGGDRAAPAPRPRSAAAGVPGPGAGAAGRPARHRLRRRGRGPAVAPRGRSACRSAPPSVVTSACSWLIAESTLKVLSTWS